MPTPDGYIDSSNLCSQAVVERVLGDYAVTSIKIYNTLESDNFSTGSAGWQINRVTGSAEFQDVVVRGSLNADDITTGTLDASVVTVTNLNASNITTGTLDASVVTVTNLNASNISTGTLGADRIAANSLAVSKISGGTYGNSDITFSSGSDLKSSNYVAGTSGWQITGAGVAEFQSATIVGSIEATSGTLSGLTVTGDLTMGSGGAFKSASSGIHVLIDTTNFNIVRYMDGATHLGSVGYSAAIPSMFLAAASGNISIELAATGTGDILLKPGSDTIINGGQLEVPAGTVGAPTYTFTSDTDTGMYQYAANQIGFAAGGTEQFRTGGSANPNIRLVAGSATNPAFTFSADADTGMYRSTTNQIGFATGGTARYLMGSSALSPAADNTYDLGYTTAGDWQDAYVTNGVTTGSDPAWKTFAPSDALSLAFIRALEPAAWRWKQTGTLTGKTRKPGTRKGKRLHHGLDAGQVAQALETLNIDTKDFAGYVVGDDGYQRLRYHEFTGPIIEAIKELANRVDTIEGN